MKPQVQVQGKCICEPSEDNDGSWLVMTPDGQIEVAPDRGTAEAICKRWFRRNNDRTKIGVGQIEWR